MFDEDPAPKQLISVRNQQLKLFLLRQQQKQLEQQLASEQQQPLGGPGRQEDPQDHTTTTTTTGNRRYRPGAGSFRSRSKSRENNKSQEQERSKTSSYARHRSSSFSHINITEDYRSPVGAKLTTTFSAELGGEPQTCLTTMCYDSSATSVASSVTSQDSWSVQRGHGAVVTAGHGQHQLGGFDIRAETDFLVTRTEELSSTTNEQEWVI